VKYKRVLLKYTPGEGLGGTLPWAVGLYKIFFHFKAFIVHESIILFVLPPPTCNAHTIAITIVRLLRNIRPPPSLPCICHTAYTIGNVNIMWRPSCERGVHTGVAHAGGRAGPGTRRHNTVGGRKSKLSEYHGVGLGLGGILCGWGVYIGTYWERGWTLGVE